MVTLPLVFSLLLVVAVLAAEFPSYENCVFDCVEKWGVTAVNGSNVYKADWNIVRNEKTKSFTEDLRIVVVNESELYSESRNRYCDWFAETIPLQRCYMSQCGGLNARVPPPSTVRPLLWPYLARS